MEKMMSENRDYDDFIDDGPLVVCPRCNGDGSVSCYCGGDQCYCDNQGDAPCPTCHEEGKVTEEVYERYIQREREVYMFMKEIFKETTND